MLTRRLPCSRILRRLGTLLLTLTAFLPALAQPPVVLEEFNQPFLFTYGTWLNRVQPDTNGTVKIIGVSNQGGAGHNLNLSLQQQADHCLTLQASVGPGNSADAIRVLLRDETGQTATWEFPLPPTNTTGFISIYPLDGQPLSEPHTTDHNQPLDLTRIRQIQIMGNWIGNLPMDLTLDAILLVPATPEIENLRRLKTERKTRQQLSLNAQLDAARQEIKTDPAGPRISHLSAASPTTLALNLQEGLTTRANTDTPFSRLSTTTADDPGSYQISSPNDFRFDLPLHPVAVHRKSKPAAPDTTPEPAATHRIYLELPHALHDSLTYKVELTGINATTNSITFTHNSRSNLCDSIHTSTIGYRPDDPIKQAFLSLWLGTGGPQSFHNLDRFLLLDTTSDKPVYGGPIQPAKTPAPAVDHPHSRTHVYTLNFSEFQQPGTYRICIPNLGCSPPFPINPTAWTHAFHTSTQRILHLTENTTSSQPAAHILQTAYLQLELLDLFPDQLNNLNLAQPSQPTDHPLPPLLSLAIRNLELLPSSPQEISKLPTALLYAYAATAARAARIIQPLDASRYTDLLQLASQAWHLAKEQNPPPHTDDAITDAATSAAVELLRLTGNPDYHRAFEQTYALKSSQPNRALAQQGPLFSYAQLPFNRGISVLKDLAKRSITDAAEFAAISASSSPFQLTTDSNTTLLTLARAHALTKDPRHLKTLIQLCSYLGGANPNNHPSPNGLLPSPSNSTRLGATLRQLITPPVREWPITEYSPRPDSDPREIPSPLATLLPLAYAHGYLAARTSPTPQ